MDKGKSAGKGSESAPGQSKLHLINDADGNPVIDPATGQQLQMTQEQWRKRDKSLGYTRPEDSELPEEEDEGGGETGGSTPS